ncbi:hypothetical protein [Hymenobacter crusticola]|uniref:Uncharacterized protein n=1 Tax=Hymenobacter crusticola TaxID=1770526 RepID=A0A243WF94_9BACT|nr:hypothetical protein [Hymenobacter crusticola]OUJ74452.1 hypothetical protein BXP70_06600 [Hymenobacter crusticola]
MGNLLTELLESARVERRIVTVRTNPSEPSRFALGYIVEHNDETVMLKMVNPNGLLHGVRAIRKGEIFQLDYDDRYIRNVELKENNLDKIYGRVKSPNFVEETYLTMPEILTKSKQLRHVIYFHTYSGMNYYGMVSRLTDDEFIADCYNEYGEPDGTSVFRLDDIKSIVWSDEDTRAIELRLALRKQEQ